MLRKVWITFLVTVFAVPAAANAHNVGHIFLPDGTCQEVGSVKEAPLVGKDRTQLDLVPETANPPRDEYGTSFVGFWGRTPIFPGRCPVVTGASSTSALIGASPNSGPATAPASSRTTAPANAGPSGPWVSFGPKRDR
jgi:hypothetical protein